MKKLLIIFLIFLTGCGGCGRPKSGANVCQSLLLQRSYLLSTFFDSDIAPTDSLIKIYCNCDNQNFKYEK